MSLKLSNFVQVSVLEKLREEVDLHAGQMQLLSYLVLLLIGLFYERARDLVELTQGRHHPHKLGIINLRWLELKRSYIGYV